MEWDIIGEINSTAKGPEAMLLNFVGLTSIQNISTIIACENKFGLKETSSCFVGFAIPYNNDVIGGTVMQSGSSFYYEREFGLLYVRNYHDKINIGIKLLYQSKRIEGYTDYNSGEASFELGAQIPIDKDWMLGVLLKNPVELYQRKLGCHSAILRTGVRYSYSNNLDVTIDALKNSSDRLNISASVIYIYNSDIILRTTISNYPFEYCLWISYLQKKSIYSISVKKHNFLGLTPSLSISTRFK